jgi:phage tail sheath protein FI
MAEYKTPGVYVEEISTFPTTVVRVATAVPVFIGYTEICPSEYLNKPVKIKTLMEYQQIFGGEPTSAGRTIEVSLDSSNTTRAVSLDLDFYLYHCLRHFYANGGGDAYILSVGEYATAPGTDPGKAAAIIAALSPLEEADEPTLILTPDAFGFASGGDLGDVQAAVLAHCAKMQDRFGILDVQMGVDVLTAATDFRTEVGNQNLKYGAAYFPVLETSLGPDGEIALASFSMLDTNDAPLTLAQLASASDDPALVAYTDAVADLNLLVSTLDVETLQDAYDAIVIPVTLVGDFELELNQRASAIFDAIDLLYQLGAPSTFATTEVEDELATLIAVAGDLNTDAQTLLNYAVGFSFVPTATGPLTAITDADFGTPPAYVGAPDYGLTDPIALDPVYGVAPADPEAAANNARASFNALMTAVLGYMSDLITFAEDAVPTVDLFEASRVLADIRLAIRNTGYTLPPSGAIAGVYAAVDASRGVWKAPANVSLNAVTSVIKMAEDELNDLNIPDDGQGKSINAIRFFRGQGNLVYGARTLAGNDNEWRYVPVRRLFIMVEESVKKATEPYVFEANNARTWLNVKSMIENFLTGIWRDGGLAGAVPQDAFFVKVGLGQTMTAQDILEGKMIIEIGMAAVRPAEFVILKFSHKLQES